MHSQMSAFELNFGFRSIIDPTGSYALSDENETGLPTECDQNRGWPQKWLTVRYKSGNWDSSWEISLNNKTEKVKFDNGTNFGPF